MGKIIVQPFYILVNVKMLKNILHDKLNVN